jgi:hypothetical protein
MSDGLYVLPCVLLYQNGITPLHWAALLPRYSPDTSKRAAPPPVSGAYSPDTTNPSEGHVDIVKLLLNFSKDPDATDKVRQAVKEE